MRWFLAFLVALSSAHGVLIPTTRLVDWTPSTFTGVIGGIPNRTTISGDGNANGITDSLEGINNTGASDVRAAIQAAVDAAASGSVIRLPAGTFRVDTTLFLGAKDNITLRGAGVGTTILATRSSGDAITITGGSDYLHNWPTNQQVVTGGLTKDSTVLTMADTSWGSVGQMVRIQYQDQRNNAAITAGAAPVFNVNGFIGNRCQITRITAKTATTLTISHGLYYTPDTTTMISVYQAQSDAVGIEDLTLECSFVPTPVGIAATQVNGCWVKNVNILNFFNRGIYFLDTLNCEVRHCDIKGPSGTGSNGAGILVENTSGLLVEDNIIREVFPSLEINAGSSVNVFAYNVLDNSNSLFTLDANHGAHPSFNLYEGNVTKNITTDGYFGSNSDDTYYRNWAHGSNFAGTDINYAVALKRFTRNYSMVGNIYGRTGVVGGITAYGQPNIGNSASTGTAQPTLGDFWQDWGMNGTLTTRTSASAGVFTLNNAGSLVVGIQATLFVRWGNPTHTEMVNSTMARGSMGCTAVSGNVVTLSGGGGADLPAQGTAVTVYLYNVGYQELDLDVQASMIDKGNYTYTHPGGTSGSMSSLGGDTLSNSLFRSAKPAYFFNRTWPPFDPTVPNSASYDDIPAGYRFVNGGADPPPEGPDTTPPTLATAVIPTSGTQLVLGLNESGQIGVGGNGGWTLTMSGGAVTLSFVSVSGSTITYNTSRTIAAGETGTIAYTQAGNGVEDVAGNDLATLSGFTVTNNAVATDTTAPTPNPMTFSSAPSAVSSSSVTMTASTATDTTSPPVQYFFDETSGNSGGTDSSWQSSATYADTGLSVSTLYTYRVKARDAALNETTLSSAANVTTLGNSSAGSKKRIRTGGAAGGIAP